MTRREKRRDAYSVLMRKPEEKASLGKQRSRWQDKMNVWDVARNVLIWLSVGGWLALVNTVMNHRVPKHERNYLTISGTRRTLFPGVGWFVSQAVCNSGLLMGQKVSRTQASGICQIVALHAAVN